MAPPPAVSPMGTPMAPGQAYNPQNPSAAGRNHQNLMEEIGNSCVFWSYRIVRGIVVLMGLDVDCRIKTTNSTTIMRVMRTVNLILAVATITVGLLAWIMGYVSSFQKIIAGIYIMYVCVYSTPNVMAFVWTNEVVTDLSSMFGALLLLFELRTEKVDAVLRANFGFMYDNRTRTIFLLL